MIHDELEFLSSVTGEWEQVLLSEERSSSPGNGPNQLDFVQVAAKRLHTLEHARLSAFHCS